MSLHMQVIFIFNILLSCLLSAIIGLDRERKKENKGATAGLRTHMLVSVGATLFTLLSIHGFGAADTSRVAAQVVTGIGFVGAGVIFVKRDSVKNLTTAASIWTTAAIGMTVGVGAWLLAIATTLIVWVVLVVLRKLEDKPSSS